MCQRDLFQLRAIMSDVLYSASGVNEGSGRGQFFTGFLHCHLKPAPLQTQTPAMSSDTEEGYRHKM